MTNAIEIPHWLQVASAWLDFIMWKIAGPVFIITMVVFIACIVIYGARELK